MPVCSMTGCPGGAGGDHPSSAGSLSRVSASPEEKTGRSVLVEGEEGEEKVEQVWLKDWECGAGLKGISVRLPFLHVLEGDPVSHAGEGEESRVPREDSFVEPMMSIYCEYLS